MNEKQQMYNTVTLKSTICQFAYSAKVVVQKILVGISYSSPVFFLNLLKNCLQLSSRNQLTRYLRCENL